MGLVEEWGIKAIAFDIDGTLYPKRQMLFRLFLSSLPCIPFALRYNTVRQRIRKEDGTGGAGGSFQDLRRRECLMMYGTADKLDAFIRKEDRFFRRRWEKSFSSIRAYPFMAEALKAASGRYKLAILSDFPLGCKLDALGVSGLFCFEASSEEFGALKPSGIPFRAMLDALGLQPEEVLYVGDSESKDIRGASAAGMRSALISTSCGKMYSRADFIFSSWKEFIDKVL